MLRGEIKHIFYPKNYWLFGPYESPGIPKTREHKVSENGSVYIHR
jgi:hypothetical protein